MTLIMGLLARVRGSSPILVFQMAALAMLVSEYSTLEIIHTSTMEYLEEGKNLNLNCLIRHQQNESSQIEAHWYKRANRQNETGFGKEMESLHFSQNSDPMAKVTSSLILQIQKVNQSGSSRYRCRARVKNTLLTAVGHFIRVNVTSVNIVYSTERTEFDLEQNKALRMDSGLEKMWTVVMISWIIVYVNVLAPSAEDDGSEILALLLFLPINLVEVPPAVTLTYDKSRGVVCQASGGKPVADISWIPASSHSTEEEFHHPNGTVTRVCYTGWGSSTFPTATCLVTHLATNQTLSIDLTTLWLRQSVHGPAGPSARSSTSKPFHEKSKAVKPPVLPESIYENYNPTSI